MMYDDLIDIKMFNSLGRNLLTYVALDFGISTILHANLKRDSLYVLK